MWLATEATATAGEMPTKIKSGVIRKPPPMPNMPDTKPTAAPIARMRKTLTGRSTYAGLSCTRIRFGFSPEAGRNRSRHRVFIDVARIFSDGRIAGDVHGRD